MPFPLSILPARLRVGRLHFTPLAISSSGRFEFTDIHRLNHKGQGTFAVQFSQVGQMFSAVRLLA